MKRPAIRQARREPIDRRQLRLIHALLAFPVAGVIGFAGNAVVKHTVLDSPAVSAPAPSERSTDEKGPHERGDRPNADDNSGIGVA
jgi:hypothetical protein